jgi:hypothetical protein
MAAVKQYDDPMLTKCHLGAYESLNRLCMAQLKLFLAGKGTLKPPYTSCAEKEMRKSVLARGQAYYGFSGHVLPASVQIFLTL